MNRSLTSLIVALLGWSALVAAADASLVYEFRQSGVPTVIATIEFDSPPASATSGWTSTEPGDLVSLFVDDALFGLGAGNVLDLFDDFLTYDVASLDGSELDFALGIQDDTPRGCRRRHLGLHPARFFL